MLSSQTRDEVTWACALRLRAAGCTPAGIAATPLPALEALLLGPPAVGFWRNKSRFLQGAAAICRDEYDGDIPPTCALLQKLPGVGPKMAFIAMHAAWGTPVGIGVDTHVHRIANRLRWVSKPTPTPEATRLELEGWLPRHLWGDVNVDLVGFGQQVCTPVNPRCDVCLAASVCPSAPRSAKAKAKASGG